MPTIEKNTITLLKEYVDNLNKQEADKRTVALIRTKNTALITEATATAIEAETNVTPQNMVTLIDRRAIIAVSKSNK